MLASLPVELLRLVIESAVPDTYRWTTYDERQATLRSLSLVSRRFRQIAQPLLLQVVRAKSYKALRHAVTAGAGKGGYKHTRCAAFNITQGETGTLSVFWRAVDIFRGLRNLSLVRDSGTFLEVSCLRDLEHLTSLQLRGARIIANGSFKLRSLQDLSLIEYTVALTDLLNPEILPSLKYLALQDLERSLLHPLALDFDISALLKLVPQLDALFVDDLIFQQVSQKLPTKHFSRILVDVLPETAFYSPYHHLHLRLPFLRKYLGDYGLAHHLSRLTSVIVAAPSPLALRSIYYDSPTCTQTDSTASISSALVELKEACRGKGIEVIEEFQGFRDMYDSVVSHAFWSRRRRAIEAGGE